MHKYDGIIRKKPDPGGWTFVGSSPGNQDFNQETRTGFKEMLPILRELSSPLLAEEAITQFCLAQCAFTSTESEKYVTRKVSNQHCIQK